MLSALLDDARELQRAAHFGAGLAGLLRAVLTTDSYRLLAASRVRQSARRRRLPLVNAGLRLAQQIYAGIEIGKDVELGAGVYFVHPVGVVIGGTSRIGKRVRFYGSNTVGATHDDGCPTIEDDVWVGAGARILGPIRVGARARIGANAVVLSDVAPDSVVVGVPAHAIAGSPPP